MSEEELAAELATLHRERGIRVENGERQGVSGQLDNIERVAEIAPKPQRSNRFPTR
ncbi:MAG: hypothetical protein QHC67_17580 [Sphingobium sp.]|uniref:hypothetical protein n=1 Tax=Sphingobium sp. TaxID=1912891 RepID=UPI0029BF98A8|nr:hypothetical protein [Sphingobium sp.]MDX3911598.1 hypothetical protein [Sphingobium sp.]